MIVVDFLHIAHKIHRDHETAGPGEGAARADRPLRGRIAVFPRITPATAKWLSGDSERSGHEDDLATEAGCLPDPVGHAVAVGDGNHPVPREPLVVGRAGQPDHSDPSAPGQPDRDRTDPSGGG